MHSRGDEVVFITRSSCRQRARRSPKPVECSGSGWHQSSMTPPRHQTFTVSAPYLPWHQRFLTRTSRRPTLRSARSVRTGWSSRIHLQCVKGRKVPKYLLWQGREIIAFQVPVHVKGRRPVEKSRHLLDEIAPCRKGHGRVHEIARTPTYSGDVRMRGHIHAVCPVREPGKVIIRCGRS